MRCAILPPHVLEAMRSHPDARVRGSARRAITVGRTLQSRRAPSVAAADAQRVAWATPARTARLQLRPQDVIAGCVAASRGPAAVWRCRREPGVRCRRRRGRVLARGLRARLHRRTRDAPHCLRALSQRFRQCVLGRCRDGLRGRRRRRDRRLYVVSGSHRARARARRTACGVGSRLPGLRAVRCASRSPTCSVRWSSSMLPGRRVDDADWLIGSQMFAERVAARGLRSLREPGHAYDDPALGGRDPQVAHMRDYRRLRRDAGAVHLNSGIPNHAFYRFAHALGGHAWHVAGHVWYEALRSGLPPTATSLRSRRRRTPQHGDTVRRRSLR